MPGGLVKLSEFMPANVTNQSASSRLVSVLKDIHFWVPVAVLIAGLVLLRLIH